MSKQFNEASEVEQEKEAKEAKKGANLALMTRVELSLTGKIVRVETDSWHIGKGDPEILVTVKIDGWDRNVTVPASCLVACE